MPRPPSHCRQRRGFTLIEAMISLAVMGILASIALPAYSDYVRRGQLPEAFNALADFRARMEQYYQDNHAYGSAAGCASEAPADGWRAFAASRHFSYSCALDSAQQGYIITATGTQGAASGHVFTIDHRGERGTTRFKGASVDASCWLTQSERC